MGFGRAKPHVLVSGHRVSPSRPHHRRGDPDLRTVPGNRMAAGPPGDVERRTPCHRSAMGRRTRDADANHGDGPSPWSMTIRNVGISINRINVGADICTAHRLFLPLILHKAGGTVTVVTPPPPERFNPHGGTNYQAVEEPILKGERGSCCVKKIELVHPTVPGAEEFCYEIWPEDETDSWTAKFAKASKSAPHPQWRHPKPRRARL